MAKRGRKSSAELGVVIDGGFNERPQPPFGLSARQSEIWKEVAASEKPDFFRTAALRALLTDYCALRESIEDICGVLNSFDPEWLKSENGVKRYKVLTDIREKEVRAAASLATKMRLTNQARYTPQAAATAANNMPRAARPWDI